MEPQNLAHVFIQAARTWPDRLAVQDEDVSRTYAELADQALRLAARIAQAPPSETGIEAFLCPRGLSAYTALLAILLAGRTYLPLSPKWPRSRLRSVIEQARPGQILIANEGDNLLAGLGKTLNITDEPGTERLRPGEYGAEGVAYLLFTSGTTGSPKGIAIRHAQVMSYLRAMKKLIAIAPEDRVSQVFDLGFDLSVHDLFMTWSAGACLVTFSDQDALLPIEAISRRRLSVWFSTPSIAARAAVMGALKKNSLPTLRETLFCGEALTAAAAASWRAAAPRSRLHNLYGPTEATIAVSTLTVDVGADLPIDDNGLVPLGKILPPNEFKIGSEEELWLRGPQVIRNYFQNVAPDKFEGEWYKTGDRVALVGQNLNFLGRNDEQVKLRGFRVELAEINRALMEITGALRVVTLVTPPAPQPAELLYTFIEGPELNEAKKVEWIARLRERLPEYMIPFDLFGVAQFPMTANGKLDRIALREMLDKNLA